MIHVRRDRPDEKGTLIRPDDAWFLRAEERTATALDEQGEHEADRNVYADPSVKAALEKLFRDKCAYCERKIEGMDVDHFRPKGRVAERMDHPGYYWLAYEWENLYPSCEYCNRRRRDRPRWDDAVEFPAGGKYDQFPVLDESTRAMGPEDELGAEQRLLIDPCRDDPEECLGYDPFGGIFSVNDPLGSRTIEVFHLQRRRLKDHRQEVIATAICVMRFVERLTVSDADTADQLSELLERITGRQSPHAGAARYVVNRPHEFGL